MAEALAVRGMAWQKLAAPILVIMVLAMMILPLPTFLLDILFTFNIALAMIVLLISLYTLKPLEFSVFPTVLLLTTLLRLSLNVASTRVVLLQGHGAADAAGKVIEAFGHFLVGGNYAVGLVVFVILVVINFVVITKGAGRIAEVSARFTLDAMPGKQMAIDADLNAGLIGEDEARRRRAEIAREADFYGSMDGASKFVRGDAVAGIIIMLINIIGGLIVGVAQHDLDFATAASKYTLLTIGDGLVAQIPALVISTAAGIVVSRVSSEQDLNEQIMGQMFGRPQALFLTSGILFLLGMIPNMPHTAFLLMGSVLAGAGYWLSQARQREAAQAAVEPLPPKAEEPVEVGWHDVSHVDRLGLEVGYRLVPLVDKHQDGDLLRRIRGIRKKIAQDLGFLVPAVHIRDNLQLKPNAYRLTLKGVPIAEGEAVAGKYLAINPGRVLGTLAGQPATDPAYGLPAVWIEPQLRDQAQTYGYTVVDASTVVATHLTKIINEHAPELLGREETQQLLDHVAKQYPKLVEDLVPKLLPVATVQKVLRHLLEEQVHIRDMRSILETLAELAGKIQDPDELTAAVRTALGRAIIQETFGGAQELQVMALEPNLEHILMQALASRGDAGVGLEPGLAERLVRETVQAVERQENAGHPAVLLSPPAIRPVLARFLRRSAPALKVLSHAEVPDGKTIRIVALIGGG
ncbi:MAG TPA: flagellar biosynthesis protein FlhA [Thiobacillaceae bacterium]|nr:flagellar biosynthesis protein FlhA [Thiobacillaceae bacterium]HNF89797.1 flagellar biosynthesis protein FlhA [Thiobacillaceae bacterium]HNH88887.1 flagellar biosynthesis protein FlhA [Thiobacillaceae bacterium]HNI08823.1 flagellar biosynthesis protein FlhA [Thiobacillaceae bacterium]